MSDTPRRPIRIVHLGLGAFHRAHQAWYTDRARDADQWGIAAFTGRRPDLANLLQPQQGEYTLVVRDQSGDSFEPVQSIVSALPASDVEACTRLLADPQVSVVTMTITEAGYEAESVSEALIDALRGKRPAAEFATTPLARLVLGLYARFEAEAGAITIVPCDNLPANGAIVRRVLTEIAERVTPAFARFVASDVGVSSTSVDRITPRTPDSLIDEVRQATGIVDNAPVVTEPFSDWVLERSFVAAHPDWESAGARIVDDVEPWEARKLWLLNGAHTILATLGLAHRSGPDSVAEAIGEKAIADTVEQWWDVAERHLPDLSIRQYRADLTRRFANARIEHRLEQIATDTATKLRLRLDPVAVLELEQGRLPGVVATTIGTWIATALVQPAVNDRVERARTAEAPVDALLELVAPRSSEFPSFRASVREVATTGFDSASNTHEAPRGGTS